MDKVLKTFLSPALDDNYLSKNNASTQVLYLNKRILSDFFQNENCCGKAVVERRGFRPKIFDEEQTNPESPCL